MARPAGFCAAVATALNSVEANSGQRSARAARSPAGGVPGRGSMLPARRAEAVAGLRARSAILDGEAVACDENGLVSSVSATAARAGVRHQRA